MIEPGDLYTEGPELLAFQSIDQPDDADRGRASKAFMPPLNALRAFDVVARMGTLTAAAKELSVSGSAVSQQIRTLERWLGIALFVRSGQRLKLTERGAEYSEAISVAMNLIAEATARLGSPEAQGKLRISVLPSFSVRWLLPRLARFNERHPKVTIDLVTSTELCHFARDDIDLAIRYGSGSYPGLVVEELLPEAVVPVCSPAFLADRGPLDRIEDLLDLPMIDDSGGLKGVKRDLVNWIMEQGGARPEIREALFLSDSLVALEAARLGKGLLLGRLVLIRDLLESGELVAPVERWMVEPTAYYVVYPGLRPLSPRAQVFRSWLRREANDWMEEAICRAIFGAPRLRR